MSEIETLPVLPLRTGVLLPYAVMPITIGRPRTESAVQAALATEEKQILVLAVKDPSADPPGPEAVYRVGTIATITQMRRMDGGTLQLIVTGLERAVVLSFAGEDPHLVAKVRRWPMLDETGPELEGLSRAVLALAQRTAELAEPTAGINLQAVLGHDAAATKIAFFVAALFGFSADKLQEILESSTARSALERLRELLAHEIAVLEVKEAITKRTASEMTEQQREHILRQQLRSIQQELGEQDPEQAEIALIEKRISETDLPGDAREEVERELERMRRLPAASQEHHVIRSRIELILDLPWRKVTAGEIDIQAARRVLDEDHHDLDDVKERILEHLAVLRLNPSAKAPIICFVGPPGVGKTSVGRSIARALGRKFERLSLGGLHDEAELRGHRRTYVGAMPGRIIQAIRSSGTSDPVLMLDEIDKLGRDFRGDPAAALLEVLDPEQHDTFHDNYLDLPFDLSRVFFITTANTLDTIPGPLLDRMEVIHLPGYTDEDKLEIAKRFLVPRERKESGLTEEQFAIDDGVVRELIAHYTREAGVRQLDQRLGSLARKLALRLAENRPVEKIEPTDLPELLGPAPFTRERWRESLPPGVAAGMAWTEAGGDILYVEATLLPESRGLVLTGHLGEVMKESAQAALSYLWANATQLAIDPKRLEKTGIHVHVPAGATPKDGPSAGVTMATAIASLATGTPVRTDTAMTGEVTLTGLVLRVGGIREKVLAASRLGIRRVILPEENGVDLAELPEEVRERTEFVLVTRVDQVLEAALTRMGRAAA
jgi:ATP-dependent Lon protease